MKKILIRSLILVAAWFFISIPGQVAQAATITPTTTSDDYTNNGNCSLREAITAANSNAVRDACAAGSGTDVIYLSAGTYSLSITGTGDDANATGDLDITTAVQIQGANATTTPLSIIDGGGVSLNDGIFHILAGGDLLLMWTKLQNGRNDGDAGGAVYNSGTFFAAATWFYANSAVNGVGGAVYNEGTATIRNSRLSHNAATILGGAIENIGSFTMSGTSVDNNYTAGGGWGGGIDTGPGTFLLNDNTISSNTADVGGGISNTSGGTVWIENTTVSSNSATTEGGGVYNESGSTINVESSILSDNTGASFPDCDGSIASVGYNLVENTSGCTITGTTTGNKTGQDPMLGPLVSVLNSMGPVRIPQPGSPAIDAGSAGTCSTEDQRHLPRPKAGTAGGAAICDIGAIEVYIGFPYLTLRGLELGYDQIGASISLTLGATAVDASGATTIGAGVTAPAPPKRKYGLQTLTYTYTDRVGNVATPITRKFYYVPILTRVAATAGTFKAPQGPPTNIQLPVKPYTNYTGDLFVRSMVFDLDVGAQYLTIDTSSPTPTLKLFNKTGREIKKYYNSRNQPIPAMTLPTNFARAGMNMDLIFDQNQNAFLLAITPKSGPDNPQLFRIGPNKIRRLAIVKHSTTVTGNILVKFLKLDNERFGLATAVSGRAGSMRAWKYAVNTFEQTQKFNLSRLTIKDGKIVMIPPVISGFSYTPHVTTTPRREFLDWSTNGPIGTVSTLRYGPTTALGTRQQLTSNTTSVFLSGLTSGQKYYYTIEACVPNRPAAIGCMRSATRSFVAP